MAQKTRFGDWDLDTVIGPNHKGVLVTITDRSTNYLLMKRVEDKSAQQTRQAIISCLKASGLPVHTLTSDNGTEFADYEQVAKALKADFYRTGGPVCASLSCLGACRAAGAGPISITITGSPERLIGQYIPKKKDFSQMSHQAVKTYQDRINDRPGKNRVAGAIELFHPQ